MNVPNARRSHLGASSIGAAALLLTAVAGSARMPSHPNAAPTVHADTVPRDTSKRARSDDADLMAGMDHDHEAMARDDMEHGSAEEALHMRMTPSRVATHADSLRADEILRQVRTSIARYADPAVAESDGYRLFLPGVKHQRVYHYTSRARAFKEAFRFDPTQPTSLLYREGPDGKKHLLGAMFTAPARFDAAKLDERIPTSIAPWHQHVNWCVPRPATDRARWLESRNGKPVFGPMSPIATRDACEAAGGRFHERIFNWMVHVNAFADDPAKVWAH